MADKKEKTVSYRRADWLVGGAGLNLERCTRDALRALKTIEQRWALQGDQIVRVANEKNSSGGLLLHLTTETPGEYASVVPKVPAGSAGLDLKTQSPPPDGEWLDGDAFLFVLDDHLCICTTGVRDAAIRSFLWSFFQKAKLREDASKFELTKVADISRIKMIQSQGVKELEIRATLSEATAHYEKRNAQAASAVGVAAKHLKAIFGKTNDVTEDALRVCLALKTDSRMKGLRLGEKRIEHLATDLVKDKEASDYVIITKAGQRISAEEIFVKAHVAIERDGKTVRRDKAWNELTKFFSALVSVGVLEQ